VVHSFLADTVLALHLAFIVFVVFGGLLGLRWRRAALLHLPAFVWGVWIELTAGVCPLTPLENRLRRAAGEAGYEGGFIEHYVVPLVYPVGITPEAQMGLGVLLLIWNLGIYGVLWRRSVSRCHP